MIPSLNLDETMVCRMRFSLCNPIVYVVIYGERLQQILGRFVVLVGGVVVYDVLTCVFWVVSDLVLPWEMTWKPNL